MDIASQNRPATEEDQVACEYLTFRLGEETFAVDVCQVREILDQAPITRALQHPETRKDFRLTIGDKLYRWPLSIRFAMNSTT